MKKGGKLSFVLIVILVLAFIYVFFVSGIIDLTNSKDINEITVSYAYDILTVENSINGLIPTGKDYYYLAICEDDSNSAYLIHSGKNWLSDNFDTDGHCINGAGISIRALAKRAGNYDVEKELESRISQVEGINHPLDFGYVLELNYVRDAIMRIAAGIVMILVIIAGIFLKKSEDNLPLAARRIYLVIVVAALVFALAVIL